ncbi:hypothetical protein [Methyloglobulus morosus]|uniref:hypothetical protein n=1 Tax=Methyloglobulus morosus TaxID=1410681 RepID=UPI0004022B1A|nr:hypothetical protein [Methyloglobulus morosus]
MASGYGLKPDFIDPMGRLQHPEIIVGFIRLLAFNIFLPYFIRYVAARRKPTSPTNTAWRYFVTHTKRYLQSQIVWLPRL